MTPTEKETEMKQAPSIGEMREAILDAIEQGVEIRNRPIEDVSEGPRPGTMIVHANDGSRWLLSLAWYGHEGEHDE